MLSLVAIVAALDRASTATVSLEVALRHALLSYVFSIGIIAMTINVVAGLVGR